MTVLVRHLLAQLLGGAQGGGEEQAEKGQSETAHNLNSSIEMPASKARGQTKATKSRPRSAFLARLLTGPDWPYAPPSCPRKSKAKIKKREERWRAPLADITERKTR